MSRAIGYRLGDGSCRLPFRTPACPLLVKLHPLSIQPLLGAQEIALITVPRFPQSLDLSLLPSRCGLQRICLKPCQFRFCVCRARMPPLDAPLIAAELLVSRALKSVASLIVQRQSPQTWTPSPWWTKAASPAGPPIRIAGPKGRLALCQPGGTRSQSDETYNPSLAPREGH